eukprot:CAMPEP_0194487268 /NCGR_PEP_ID=MMETSP0253-20130528/7617_1 /TAXON_ID=2966 /ORGANISM="Noctiluca scintillans" /LENGTH=190 /DNA_ID=CAMNT_0039327469 /DNA_START=185 /DNA_END=754 /DNA_ORIENTATION=+
MDARTKVLPICCSNCQHSIALLLRGEKSDPDCALAGDSLIAFLRNIRRSPRRVVIFAVPPPSRERTLRNEDSDRTNLAEEPELVHLHDNAICNLILKVLNYDCPVLHRDQNEASTLLHFTIVHEFAESHGDNHPDFVNDTALHLLPQEVLDVVMVTWTAILWLYSEMREQVHDVEHCDGAEVRRAANALE